MKSCLTTVCLLGVLDYPGKDTVVVVVCVCVDPDGQRRVPKGSGRDPVGCVIFRTLSAQDTMLRLMHASILMIVKDCVAVVMRMAT